MPSQCTAVKRKIPENRGFFRQSWVALFSVGGTINILCSGKPSGDDLDAQQEAWKQFEKDNIFKDWMHKKYKPDVKGDGNPDLSKEAILDGYELWKSLGCPSAL